MCNTDQLTNHDKVYSILDAEIKRKGITPDAKTRLPLGLIAVEALQRTFPCEGVNETGRTLMSGSRFVDYCNSDNEALKGICAGFVAAIADLLDTAPLYRRRACLSKGFTIREGVGAVQKWVRAHPGDEKYDAREI